MFNYYLEMSDRCGELLAKSREKVKLSRCRMGSKIGISESTVKAWEAGEGSPTLSMLVRWFRATGCNFYKCMLDFFWPEYFENLSFKSSDKQIRKAVCYYIENIAHSSEIEKIDYLVFNDFGGDWKGILDMIMAYSSISLNIRYCIAESVLTSYELSVANNSVRVLENIKFNNELLNEAVTEAKKAIMIDKKGFLFGAWNIDFSALTSKILSKSRIDSGKTQLYMAKAIGKSERTIQNWESNSEPTFLELCYWLRILNKDFWRYASTILYHDKSVEESEKTIALRKKLQQYFAKADRQEVRKMAHLITGDYGSYWNAVLEMVLVHVCTPLYQRIMTARTILISYELDGNNDFYNGTGHIVPNIENLKNCIESATNAAKLGKNSYKI